MLIELNDPVLFDEIHNDVWDKVQHDTSVSHYGVHHHKNTYQTIDSCQHHLNYKVCTYLFFILIMSNLKILINL